MDRDEIIARLKAEEPALRARGVQGLSLFGSLARGEAGPQSDVDVAITIDRGIVPPGFASFALLDGLSGDLRRLLNRKVDVVPVVGARTRIAARIARDRVRVF